MVAAALKCQRHENERDFGRLHNMNFVSYDMIKKTGKTEDEKLKLAVEEVSFENKSLIEYVGKSDIVPQQSPPATPFLPTPPLTTPGNQPQGLPILPLEPLYN